ncbi:hypothetical protein DK058_15445 [Salmonella enterica subsp. enterica serovar Typhi]|nr:hypothetical protein [Salmonella enterica subsp. enterica serovar Typhi]
MRIREKFLSPPIRATRFILTLPKHLR